MILFRANTDDILKTELSRNRATADEGFGVAINPETTSFKQVPMKRCVRRELWGLYTGRRIQWTWIGRVHFDAAVLIRHNIISIIIVVIITIILVITSGNSLWNNICKNIQRRKIVYQ